jgi:ATP synthase protein I
VKLFWGLLWYLFVSKSMFESSDLEKVRSLERRIYSAKASRSNKLVPKEGRHDGQIRVAWRMITELVAGLMVGFFYRVRFGHTARYYPFIYGCILIAGFYIWGPFNDQIRVSNDRRRCILCNQ